jgi:hypothetical protein
MVPQHQTILKYMQEFGEITQREAIYLGCYRLAAVIFVLKKQGVSIKTELREVEKSDGTKTRIAAYSLMNGGEEDG